MATIAVVLFGCEKPTQEQPVGTDSKPNDEIGFTYSNVPPNSAWWLRFKFIPRAASIRGIPASQLVSNWVRVAELRRGLIPEKLVSGKEGGLAWNPNFAVEGDFNGDGKVDHALLGVYEDKDGKFGSFILVLTVESDNRLRMSFLKSFEGEQGPIDLSWDGAALTLAFCTSCDGIAWVVWNKVKGGYEIRHPSFG